MIQTIALGADHAGFALKEEVRQYLEAAGEYKVLDCGTHSEESTDYPDYGYAVVHELNRGHAQRGVIVCGTGIGISIAANRCPNIRAALCVNTEMAKLARMHNDANILALGSRVINAKTALECVDTFLQTSFEGGRHVKRLEKLNIKDGFKG